MELKSFLSRSKNYDQMLNKIFLCTFASCFLYVNLMESFIPSLHTFLSKLVISIPTEWHQTTKITAEVFIALIVAFLFRMVKMHDRVSDLFQIRKNFDHFYILLPLANGAGVALGLNKIEEIKLQRNFLMKNVFYKYASSTKPQIDAHLVLKALDAWTWYWALIENIVIGAICFVILLAGSIYGLAAYISAFLILVLIALPFFIRLSFAANASSQIESILSIKGAKSYIAGEFNAL